MPYDAQIENEITVIQGIKGFGKTNGVKWLLKEKPKVFIIDIRNEYKHVKHYYSFASFLQAILTNGDFSNTFQVGFTFHSKQEYIKLFNILQGVSNCTLVLDEADSLFQIRDFMNPLFNIFLGSRNKQVDIFLVSKRPFFIPPAIRSQTDKFIIFRIEEEQDINYLEKRLRSDLPKSPVHLARGECIIRDRDEKPRLYHFEKFKYD